MNAEIPEELRVLPGKSANPLTDLLHLHGLDEVERDSNSAPEVNPVVCLAAPNHQDPSQSNHAKSDRHPRLLILCERNARGIKNLEELEVLEKPKVDHPAEDQAGDIDRGKKAGEKTGNEGDGEALHGTGAHVEEDVPGDDGRQVRVKNDPKSPLVPGCQGLGEGFPLQSLLPVALEDEDVGIHGHSKR